MRPHISALFLLAASCGLDEFEHTMTDEATIPGNINMQSFGVMYRGGFGNGVDLSKEKSFDNAGVSPDDVDAIYVKSVRVEGTKPQIDRLDVLFDSITLWVEAPGVARIPIATKSDFAMGAVADLDVMSNVNLKPYATAERMVVGTDVQVRQTPAFETTLRTTITLLIDIDVAGL